MLRSFPEHVLRQADDLAGVWDFAFLGDVDASAVDVTRIAYDDVMPVPMCFDATPKYAGKRGVAAYRRRITLVDDTRHRLVFGGLHHYGRLYVDGKLIQEHTAGGFVRFTADVLPHAAGDVELVVLVDNRYDPKRAPLHVPYADWYHYGGLTRGIELHRLGDAWINALRVTTTNLAKRKIRVAVAWGSDARVTEDVPLRIDIDGATIVEDTVTLRGKGGELTFDLTVPNGKPWSPQSPNLHLLSVRLGDDDLRDRIGLREVKVKGRQVLLNGEPLRLLGVNRHEAHPQFGHAIPEAIMLQDLQIIRDMGCNFIRGSHYPQDQKFLDLCDQLGFLVWNESIGWQFKTEHLTSKPFMKSLLANTELMVEASYNRPCVIMWGIINESPSDDKKNRPSYAALLGRLKGMDATRPVTYACNTWKHDAALDLCDIVSLNIYPGWYWDRLEDLDGDAIAKIIRHVDGRMGNGRKPMIISEIGADAIPGCRDWNADRWSEQYQASLLEKVIDSLFVRGDRVCGLAIWQYCDMRSSEGLPRVLGKPCGYNKKGIVTEYRLPKMAYWTVKERYTKLGRR